MKNFSGYLSTWRSISWHAKIKFFHAIASLITIKTGLTILPFSTFRRLYYWLANSGKSKNISASEIKETVWAVDTAANLLPFELLCLPRALATKYLLRKVPALSLEIGIEINPAKAFEAHAWVEKEGEILIGDWSESISYQRLWVWK